ncbi:MAG: response regulator transcription factor [Spirochaetaceae bacterium]|jgi:DNA-binding response OmpR family regulator|nr:response regulator transcription factor [Spirochaetaceae bacterium]
MKILIIEDDEAIAEVERDFLEISGFEVVTEPDGIKGMEKALTGGFSLILLDLMLPGKSGYEICKSIRGKIDIPILMVTARLEDIDKVRGFGLGADDYISKPFSPTELAARVKAHIARYERLTRNGSLTQAGEEIDTGWLVLNSGTRRVLVSGREINLTNKEYELLYFLASHPEIVFSKERIYNQIWGGNRYGDLKTVTVHIKRLREKIVVDPVNPRHIQTAWGAGYRFVP